MGFNADHVGMPREAAGGIRRYGEPCAISRPYSLSEEDWENVDALVDVLKAFKLDENVIDKLHYYIRYSLCLSVSVHLFGEIRK